MILPWQVHGEKFREPGMKRISALGNWILESLGENAREFQEAMQSLLDSRPVILSYNRDGKLQAVSGQCHSRFTTLTPYIQRLLHQNTVPWAVELMWAHRPHCSKDLWVPSLASCTSTWLGTLVPRWLLNPSNFLALWACFKRCKYVAGYQCHLGKEDWASPSEGGQAS